MDGSRFDDFTRRLARGASRRSVLKGLAGGAAGTALGVATLGGADAYVCRQAGATCLKDDQCCSYDCDRSTYRCNCPNDETLCGRTCLDTLNNPDACGGCPGLGGEVCGGDFPLCRDGLCCFACGESGPCCTADEYCSFNDSTHSFECLSYYT